MTLSTAGKLIADRDAAIDPPEAAQKGLRADAARWRRRQNRLAIALGLVMALGALAVYLPLRNTLEQTRANIEATEAELAENRSRAAALPQLRATVRTLEQRVKRYRQLGPVTDLGFVMQQLSEIKERTRPDKYRLDSLSWQRHPTCIEQPLRLTFEANFVDAMAFIGQVESLEQLLRVRDVTVTRQGDALNGKGGRVTVVMALSLFFENTAAANTPAGGARR